jgi:hypothetical protein
MHIVQALMDWLLLYGIILIKWPVYSPDLNLIEYIWKAFKAKLRRIYLEYITLKKNKANRKLLIRWI